MKLSKIIQKLDQFAPPEIAPFDYAGFLIPSSEKEIKKIGLTLDATLYTLQKAAAEQCDLLLTHHGPLQKSFSPTSVLDQRRIAFAKQHNLALYRMHLNLDFCSQGNAEILCQLLRFRAIHPAPTSLQGNNLAIGAFVAEGKFTLHSLIKRVKRLHPHSLRVVPSTKRVFHRVAVAPGAGFEPEFLEQIPNIDAFISGELQHITIVRAIDLDICLLEATHASSENEPLRQISGILQNLLHIPVFFIESEDRLQVIPL